MLTAKALIWYLILLLLPFTESLLGLGAHKMFAFDGAFAIVEFQLVVNKRVIKIYGLCIVFGVAVAYPAYASPVERAQAHRAGLARAINRATRELKCRKFVAGIPDCHHLGVGGGIVVGYYTISSRRNNFSVTNDDGSKRASSAIDILNR